MDKKCHWNYKRDKHTFRVLWVSWEDKAALENESVRCWAVHHARLVLPHLCDRFLPFLYIQPTFHHSVYEKDKRNSNLPSQKNSADSGHITLPRDLSFYPPLRQRESSAVERGPGRGLHVSSTWLRLTPPFLFCKTFLLCLQFPTACTPAG